MSIKMLSAPEALALDQDLMNKDIGGFSLDQLMEIAGLSCACALTQVYDRATFPRVLVIAGPGNNGGDALVAARHLFHFGYKPTILYPKPTQKDIYIGLVKQCKNLDIPFVDSVDGAIENADVVLDGIFGFSFSGDIRPPFDNIIKTLKKSSIPIVSIDIPSGWDVEKGNVVSKGLDPEMLISLTAPKPCALHFRGKHHYLGLRIVPPFIDKKYGLNLPEYPGIEQCVRLPSSL
ncbi:hypothetical protein SmJEL517_g04264 [Synchytrium microbalum]|uniref:NAD(P)H-hydrate epimerase n=1 Tax=Synchytrium microbalum TaxID=1806994 RepID=A0A507C3Q7_9FUNG|nr:uncharacterized protein SmJEL517_g04264 [Synchytrium microbalum]TPX32596.1 hypothetical protein SmJEL517_g04264 [Synchytrium microbalum]